jgi:hypothetical protein
MTPLDAPPAPITNIFLFSKLTIFVKRSVTRPKPSVVSPNNLSFFIEIVFTDLVCSALEDNSSQIS